MRKKQDKGDGDAGMVCNLNKVIKEGLAEKVTFELRPEGNQGVSQGGIWGKFQAEEMSGERSRVGETLR